MIRVTIRRQKRPGERWEPLAEAAAEPGRPAVLPAAEAAESDLLALRFLAVGEFVPAFRVFVGSVLVASTQRADHVGLIDFDEGDAADAPSLACRGKFLADWVGVTELAVKARQEGGEWRTAFVLPLAVTAGKMAMEELDQLFRELEHDSAAVLLDVHGKTRIGLKEGKPLAPSAPAAVLRRLRETLREMDQLLHLLARHPASRLRSTVSREPALIGQAISEATLAEACNDPGMLHRAGSRLVFREHVRERSRPDYHIPEHRTIADFLEYLKAQLMDLHQRIELETAERLDRKRWRNQRPDAARASWWEAEDQPRIEELARCREEVVQARKLLDGWSALPFLPEGRCLNERPRSTPLFRNHAAYRRVFRVMAGHFQMYHASLDTQQMLTQARSLPVLYEWWCAVQVIRVLSRGLTPLAHDGLDRPIVTTRLAQQGKRFTIEFSPDRAIDFTDASGALVRFRYQPAYGPADAGAQAGVSLLDAAALRTPDMAVELFTVGSSRLPELIIVLDAKYSSVPQRDKLAEVTAKYSKIGELRTGRILSRQVWALTPSGPARVPSGEELRSYCTVDNEGFWSEGFDLNNPVNGAVQTRPIGPNHFDPLQALLVSLLRRAGVKYGDDSG